MRFRDPSHWRARTLGACFVLYSLGLLGIGGLCGWALAYNLHVPASLVEAVEIARLPPCTGPALAPPGRVVR